MPPSASVATQPLNLILESSQVVKTVTLWQPLVRMRFPRSFPLRSIFGAQDDQVDRLGQVERRFVLELFIETISGIRGFMEWENGSGAMDFRKYGLGCHRPRKIKGTRL